MDVERRGLVAESHVAKTTRNRTNDPFRSL